MPYWAGGVTVVGCDYERVERSHVGHAGDEIDQVVLEGLGLCMAAALTSLDQLTESDRDSTVRY